MAHTMDLVVKDIIEIFKNSNRINSILKTIEEFKSEHLFLTGGSLRNVVWNSLHFYTEDYELEDCDIIFYNQFDTSKEYETFIRQELNYLNPNIRWSVKNQARMHIRNNHTPYTNITDALKSFPETCSAIAIDKNWSIISPYGLNDLVALLIKPTKFCLENEIEVFYNRLAKKTWLDKWSDLILYENTARNKRFSPHWLKSSNPVGTGSTGLSLPSRWHWRKSSIGDG